ncbi:uncharacterized protein LOC142881263, partial [Nelusetta ayraudi]|uniref:uncharacterized protein LOC142881263 n=1 Tax=Nelusetta ayraudi TaxID=303726 RepID=UPI003F6E56FF
QQAADCCSCSHRDGGRDVEGGLSRQPNTRQVFVWCIFTVGTVCTCSTTPVYFSQGTKLTVLEENRQVTLPTVQIIKPLEEQCRNQKDKGSKKTLVCVASDFYPDHASVSWEQNGEEVKDGVTMGTAALWPEEENYYKISSRLRVSADTWFNPGTQFKCVVRFFDGTIYIIKTDIVNGEPKENCQVTPPTVKLIKPSEEECRNQKDNGRNKTLVCVASDFYPDHVSVSWEQNGEEVKDGVATDTVALRPPGEKFYKMSSRLRVSADTWLNPDTQFTCIVKFFDGEKFMITTAMVNGEPEENRQVTSPTVQIIKPSEEQCRNQKDKDIKKTLVCVASGFYPDHASMSWEQNGKEVKDGVAMDTATLRPEGEQYYIMCSRLRVSADTWFNPGTQFTCIVKLFDGTNNRIKMDQVNGESKENCQVTAPTVNLMKPPEEECRNNKDKGRKKTLVCMASGFYPEQVSVSWEQNGEEVKDGVATDTAALQPEGEKFYKISSRLRVSADTWFNPGTQFKCIVKILNGTSDIITTDTVNGEPEETCQVTPPTVNLITPSEEECRSRKDNGRIKTLVCVASVVYPDHVSVSWEQNGEEVKDGVATDTAPLRPQGEQYYKISSRLTVSADTWFNPDTQFKCIVKIFNGTSDIITTDTVNGEPEKYPPVTSPTVKLLKPSEEECRNQKDNRRKKTLVCVASHFYPDHVSVSWQQNGEEVKDGVATDTAALRPQGKDYYKISSRLRVSADTWFNPDTQFKCIVKFFNGTNYINETDTVNGDPAPVMDSLTREKYLKISQSAKLSYIVFIAKSCVYGAFVAFLLYKLQRSAGKLSR